MKFVLAVFTFAFTVSAQAKVQDISCVATEVSGGPLEESFSVDEYPEVTIDADGAYIGSSAFGSEKNDSVKVKENQKTITAVINNQGAEQFILVIKKQDKSAKMYYQSEGQKEEMATLTCE